jgi:protein gp37
MAEKTGIQWTDHTANFWWGCMKVSPGCANCYAEAWSKRYGRAIWGPAATTTRWRTKGPWRDILRWDARAAADGVRRRVFAQSMSDFFEEHPQLDEWRAEACEILAGLKHLDVQLLTKRPENIRRMVPAAWWEEWPAHIWVGTSVENQQHANERIRHLLAVPAAIHFLSCEPLLGEVDLIEAGALYNGAYPGIDWVIAGGESGPKARPMHPDWARSLRDQCQEAGVPFHFKQWGEYGTTSHDIRTGQPVFRHFQNEQQWISKAHWINGGVCVDATGVVLNNGADFAEAHYPVAILHRVGKKRAGRLLDGREWNEFPQTPSA